MTESGYVLVTKVGPVRLVRKENTYMLLVRDDLVDTSPVDSSDRSTWRLIRHFEALKTWVQEPTP